MKNTALSLVALCLLSFACKKKPAMPTFTSSKSASDLEEIDTESEDLPEDEWDEDEEELTEDDDEEDKDGDPKSTTPPDPKTSEPDPKTTKPEPVDPDRKLDIKIQGRQLLVDGKPFQMKGVCWSPIPKGKTLQDGPLFQNPSADDLKAIERDFQLMTDAGINTLRPYSLIENDKVLSLLNKYGLFVIVPVLNGYDVKMDEVKRIVGKLKNHRSTLMWQVGNEWNYNLLYGAPNFEAAKAIVKQAGAAIKSVDKSIPTATNWGEMVDPNLVRELSDYDIWGMNIYQGKTFAEHFNKYKAITGKPLYIGEFGADAFNRKINGRDEDSQAVATEQLLKEMENNLSSKSPENATMGGAIFEWNDEWWKDPKGRADAQDAGGIAPGGGPYPDAEFNEEWWGIVDIDRKPRPAYHKLKAIWKK